MKLARRLDRRAALRKNRRSAVKEQIRRGLFAERLEERSLLAADVFQSDYWNSVNPADVTADGHVAPNDALEIINSLNAYGSYQLPRGLAGAEGEDGTMMYVDVDNDGYISPNDALTVINELNAEGAPPDGIDDFVEYELRALQPGTDIPITSVQGGQDYDLAVYVQDLRTDGDPNRGVFSAYLDLFYDAALSLPQVAEVQTIVVTGANNSSFRLSLDTATTANISLPATGGAASNTNKFLVADRIETALNAVLGPNTVIVSPTNLLVASYSFSIWFVGRFGENLNKLTSLAPTSGATATATIKEAADNVDNTFQAVDGDITNPVSFIEAFRSRDLGIDNGLPGPYQKDPSAVFVDASGAVSDNSVLPDPPSVPTATSFTGNLQLSAKDTFYAGARLEFLSGLLDGQTRTVTSYDGATRTFTFDTAFTGAPLLGDTFRVNGKIDEMGSFAGSTDPLGANAFLEVVRVRMKAVLPVGQTIVTQTFTPDFGKPNVPPPPNDFFDGIDRPAHNTLTYANVDVTPKEITFVDPKFIAFNILTLDITSGPIRAESFSVNVDENSQNTVITLLNRVFDNPGDPANPVIEISAVGVASAGGVATKVGNTVDFDTVGEFSGPVTFTYTARVVGDSDPSHEVTATVTVIVGAVNDPPLNAIPGPQSMSENTPLVFSTGLGRPISFTDVDAGAATDMEVELTVAQGTLTLGSTANVTFLGGTANNSGNVRIQGTVGNLNAALQGLTYTAVDQPNASVNLVVVSRDNGNTGGAVLTPQSDTDTIAINITAVNDPPVLTAPGNVAVAFVDTLTFNGANAITVTDVDTSSLSVNLQVSGGVGTLAASNTGTAVVSGTGTNLTITGSPADVTAALSGMVLTPPPGNTDVLTGAIAVAVNDGGPALVTANIVVNVIPPNLPFAINDTPQNLVEGSASYTVDVLANDLTNDPANNDPVLIDFTQPMRGGQQVGTVTLDPGPTGSASDDKLVFNVPGGDTNFFTPAGQDITFTYTMNEGPTSGGVDATATVTIRIANDPDVPIATPDSYATTVGVALSITDVNEGLLKRGTDDSSIDNTFGDLNVAVLTVLGAGTTARATAQGGSVVIAANGTFTYTPPGGGFFGTDTFTYQALSTTANGTEVSLAATVTIKVASPPIATNDSFTVLEQGNPAVSGNVLTGAAGPADDDTDPTELQALTAVNLVQSASTADGTVTLALNGDFTYTPEPNQNFNGIITFTYQAQATDGRLSNVATVTLTVQEVNDPPTANNDTFTAVRQQSGIGIDQPVAVLTGPGADSIAPDVGETLTVTGIATSAGGPFVTTATPTSAGNGASVRVDANGQILYTSPTQIPPNTDVFFYQISDGRGGTAVARVDVSVVDFVPKTIGGTVYIDSDNDGVFDLGEKALAGVTVRLTGTSFDAAVGVTNNVSLTAITDINGNYVFPQKPNEPGVEDTTFLLKPPSAAGYTITEIDPWGLQSGRDTDNSTNNFDHDQNAMTAAIHLVTNSNPLDNTFLVKWAVADNTGDVTGLNFGEIGVDLRPVSEGGTLISSGGFKHEFLASSGSNGFVLAVDLAGNLMWSWTLDDPDTVSVAWANAKSIHVVLSADLSTLTLTVRDGQNQTFVRTLTQGYSIPGSTARFRVLATGTAGQYIIRIDGSANGPGDGMGMILLAAAPAAMAGAEGEAGVNREYANSADAVFADSAWA